tara:strand:- start:431 stop:598 length:168 start_codon:yes stop_codon:yes gene_type:complete
MKPNNLKHRVARPREAIPGTTKDEGTGGTKGAEGWLLLIMKSTEDPHSAAPDFLT